MTPMSIRATSKKLAASTAVVDTSYSHSGGSGGRPLDIDPTFIGGDEVGNSALLGFQSMSRESATWGASEYRAVAPST
eukprot:CAMPEP_0198454372 /NCGR_PEP_ID=MMETSP1453-20131121/12654_1 /TAXON_ID=1461543 ORGANISM="Unidentified sp., Strain RCC701" /NCGR_SAMPLE_ID=MMETSP1453 /ASSEMBLY_ACC=CAM_ASM_001118 /LENGTH=77 /DNA_ID=CAMNT_0044178369 /DNA_START=1 /DNA_END=230 /DNA_ORIENTATION=+